jgi:hypothetical protein
MSGTLESASFSKKVNKSVCPLSSFFVSVFEFAITMANARIHAHEPLLFHKRSHTTSFPGTRKKGIKEEFDRFYGKGAEDIYLC